MNDIVASRFRLFEFAAMSFKAKRLLSRRHIFLFLPPAARLLLAIQKIGERSERIMRPDISIPLPRTIFLPPSSSSIYFFLFVLSFEDQESEARLSGMTFSSFKKRRILKDCYSCLGSNWKEEYRRNKITLDKKSAVMTALFLFFLLYRSHSTQNEPQ